jgi:hypothetical protein
MVREGSKGWFGYDRERKGPALVGTNPAVNLTKEKAERILRSLDAQKKNMVNETVASTFLALIRYPQRVEYVATVLRRGCCSMLSPPALSPNRHQQHQIQQRQS